MDGIQVIRGFTLYVRMVAGPVPTTFTWFLPSLKSLFHWFPQPCFDLFFGPETLTTRCYCCVLHNKGGGGNIPQKITLKILIPDGNGYLGYCFFLRSTQNNNLLPWKAQSKGLKERPIRQTGFNESNSWHRLRNRGPWGTLQETLGYRMLEKRGSLSILYPFD